MSLSLSEAAGHKWMLSFTGTTVPPFLSETIEKQTIAGVTLYRALNVASPAQVRELTGALQRMARAANQPPLLIGVDQETGMLFAIPGTTPFPGNLALGATREPKLAERMGYAVGRELAAMGVNVNYAPVCDVNLNPQNAVVGARSFGEDVNEVARLAAAYVRGIQQAGVAATAKHFPGHGDTATDSHYATPILNHGAARLRAIEFPPFRAAIEAGAKVVLTAHLALPQVDRHGDLPATLSRTLLQTILREELGFRGVILSDAMDMGAVGQERRLIIDSIAAVAAGIDVMLSGPAQAGTTLMYDAMVQAAERELIAVDALQASAERIVALKEWCGQVEQPALDVVNCAEHNGLADEIATRSITLVRDETRQLPLRLSADARVLCVVPTPADLTPADTSSYERVALADALCEMHGCVDEIVVPLNPSEAEIAAVRARFDGYEQIVIGTLNAMQHPGQAELVQTALASGIPTVVIALRMPYDLLCFENAPTYVCAYSIQTSSLRAAARVLFGQERARGALPVSLGELYKVGYGT